MISSVAFYLEIACRWIFGLQMIFWGLNGFFYWMKIPPSGEGVEKFVEACINTKFIMPTVKMVEVVCGILLVLNFAVPLLLLIFAPIVFVVVCLHLWHNPRPWSVVLPIGLPFVILLVLDAPAMIQTFL